MIFSFVIIFNLRGKQIVFSEAIRLGDMRIDTITDQKNSIQLAFILLPHAGAAGLGRPSPFIGSSVGGHAPAKMPGHQPVTKPIRSPSGSPSAGCAMKIKRPRPRYNPPFLLNDPPGDTFHLNDKSPTEHHLDPIVSKPHCSDAKSGMSPDQG